MSRLTRPSLRRARVSSQLSLEAPRTTRAARLGRGRTRCSGGDGPTLSDTLARVWEGLYAAGAADCPLCGATIGPGVEGEGVCRGCGSRVA